MNIYNYDIVFQEVPDEISLCITVCGCSLKCRGCHSSHTWQGGSEFGLKEFKELLAKYDNFISCICFMGGEWHEDVLVELLEECRNRELKTCLYTGLGDINDNIKNNLDYLKTGQWIPEKGGLDSKSTNQKFIDIQSNKLLNYKFRKNVH